MDSDEFGWTRMASCRSEEPPPPLTGADRCRPLLTATDRRMTGRISRQLAALHGDALYVHGGLMGRFSDGTTDCFGHVPGQVIAF